MVVDGNQRAAFSSSTNWTQAVVTSLVLTALCRKKNAVSRYAIQVISSKHKHQRTQNVHADLTVFISNIFNDVIKVDKVDDTSLLEKKKKGYSIASIDIKLLSDAAFFVKS